MQKKIIYYILFIFILIFTIILGLLFLYEPKIDVYVSSHTLNEYEVISDEDIKSISIPKYLYVNDMIVDKNKIIGKYIKNDFTLITNTIFFYDQLEDEKMMIDNIHRKLSKNEVNYDLYIDDIKGNINHLNEDMLIDLYLTIKNKDGNIDSDLLISNVRINAIYDQDGFNIKNHKDKKPISMSIRIKKEYVTILNKALNIGDLSFIVTENAYTNNESIIIKESSVMKYLN